MKRVLLLGFLTAASLSFAAQQQSVPVAAAEKPAANKTEKTQVAQNAKPATSKADNGGLEKVLSQMDATAAKFTSAQADVENDNYSKVVDEHDTQKGTTYFRRGSRGLEMAVDFTQPDKKYVLFSEGSVQIYEPKIDQVTKYNAGKNRAAMESFLVLGFGGRGHDLAKQFEVKYAGMENVGGVNAAKLELVPKQASVKNMFNLITLWIDPAKGVSVQQKLMDDRSGDYRLAKYTNIKINEKVQDSVFKLKTTSKTKVVSPQG